MASPITTSGFRSSVLPSVQYADPRLLAPRYGDIIPNIQSGVEAANRFYQLAENASMRPTRRRMAELALGEAEAEAQLAPAIRRRKAIEAGMPVTRQVGTAIEEVPRVLEPLIDPETGAVVLDATGQPMMQNTAGQGDIMEMGVFEEIDPATGAASTRRRPTRAVQTFEAGEREQSLAEARLRSGQREFERDALIRAKAAALDAGNTQLANEYERQLQRLAATPGVLPTGTVYQRTMEKQAADAGLPLELAAILSQTPEGADAMAALAAKRKADAAGRLFTTGLNAEQQAAIDAARAGRQASAPAARASTGAVTDAVAAAEAVLGGAGAPRSAAQQGTPISFATEAEVEAAAARGEIQPGDKIIVGGRRATYQ